MYIVRHLYLRRYIPNIFIVNRQRISLSIEFDLLIVGNRLIYKIIYYTQCTVLYNNYNIIH